MKQMTVSVAKGSKTESSTLHNDRKTNLKNASEKKKKAFYSQSGHKHIQEAYTYLNEDLIIKDKKKVYDELFEDAVKKYNASKSRDDRKIGKGKALTLEEKEAKINLFKVALEVRKMKKSDREQFLKIKNKDNNFIGTFKTFLRSTSNLTRRDLRKELTRIKHAKTLGEAYYDKQKHSKKSQTHQEFIIQIGNIADFNKMDPNNPDEVIKSLDRTDPDGIWQKAKGVLEKYLDTFQERNPNMIVCNASIHMDEASPHLHLQVIPWCDVALTTKRGKKRNGLERKYSFNGALEAEGYKRKEKDNRAQFVEWAANEQKELAKIMQNELGITRKLGKTNHFKNVHEYKEYKRQESKVIAKINETNKKLVKQVSTYHNNKAVLDKQEAQIQANQNKLDEIADFPTKLANFNSKKEKAQKEQEEAEKARGKALQQQKASEKAKENADKQAKLANIVLVNQLNKRKEKQDAREAVLKAREKALTNNEVINRNKEKALIQRENDLNKRENVVSQKETKLADFDGQIKTKQTKLTQLNENLSAYRGTLDKKKKDILNNKNKELNDEYRKLVKDNNAKITKLDKAYNDRKQKYSSDLKLLHKERNRMISGNQASHKLLSYASYIYHSCAETFIKTIDPQSNNTYHNGFHESEHTEAYDMSRGQYHNTFDQIYSGKSSLECCLIKAQGNKKHLWKAIKATGKKLVGLLNNKQVKALAKQLDEVDESGLSDTVVAQATQEQMKQEQLRQDQLEQEKQANKARIRNMNFNVDTSRHQNENSFENPYNDEFDGD